MEKFGIGIIGSRFAAELHAHALGKLRGVKCEILAVCSKTRESAEAFARKFNIREGLVSLWSMHTTCSLFINEFQTALLTDIKRFLEQMVARDAEWMHNNPDHSDCDRMNADSHLRALMLGHSLTLQVSGGEVVLGQWQRILMAELDGPRARTLRIQIWGIS